MGTQAGLGSSSAPDFLFVVDRFGEPLEGEGHAGPGVGGGCVVWSIDTVAIVSLHAARDSVSSRCGRHGFFMLRLLRLLHMQEYCGNHAGLRYSAARRGAAAAPFTAVGELAEAVGRSKNGNPLPAGLKKG